MSQASSSLEEALCRAIEETGSIKSAAERLGVRYYEAYSIAVSRCGHKPRHKERLTEDVKKMICDMLSKGMKVAEVARKLGVGAGTVERVKEEYCGLPKKRAWRRTSEEEKLEICKKLAECWGTRGCQKTVAKATGKSEATISRIARWCREKRILS